MTLLDKLEKRFGRFAIPNLSLWLIIGQMIVFGLAALQFPIPNVLFYPDKVMQGEVWRIFTFILQPEGIGINDQGRAVITTSILWIILGWYVFRLFGGILEREWGEFRFNVYMLIGFSLTVIAGMINLYILPGDFRSFYVVTNFYLMSSLIVPCAILFPNLKLLFAFVLPVEIKWLSLLMLLYWAFNAKHILDWLLIFAALANVVLFFGRSFFQGAKARQRRVKYETEKKAEKSAAFHTCVICGKTDITDPELEFAYHAGDGYCEDHWEEMDKRVKAPQGS